MINLETKPFQIESFTYDAQEGTTGAIKSTSYERRQKELGKY